MNRLSLLDCVRFLAAIMVVLFHYAFNGIINGKISSISHIPSVVEWAKYGYLGVELFFMISGYVIFFSARNSTASHFIVSRAVRLYPAYWFSILLTSFFAMQWGGEQMSVSLLQIAANFSMLQSFMGFEHVDGVYWTLVYELAFYFAVFLLLALGFQKNLNSIFMCWPILFYAAIVLDKQWLPYLGGYYYYFSAGAIFAIARDSFNWRTALSLIASYTLCMSFSVGKATQLTQSKGFEYSPVVIGAVVTVFFALFSFQNTKKAQSLKLPMSRTVGSLTYPVYLIHAHLGYMFINYFATEENKIAIYILAIFLVLAVAFFVHKVVEVRFSCFWENVFSITIGRVVSIIQGIPLRIQAANKNRVN